MIYPAIYIIYYSVTKGKTWFDEPILTYNTYLIIAGFVLLVGAIWGLMELIGKSKRDTKISLAQKEYDDIKEILKAQGLSDEEIKQIIDAKKLEKFLEKWTH